MSETLPVRLHGEPIGKLLLSGALRSPEDWQFTYDGNAAEVAALGLSLSLPVRPEPYHGAVVRNWFANLLPEGRIKESVANRLRISPSDDFALLAAIGGECAWPADKRCCLHVTIAQLQPTTSKPGCIRKTCARRSDTRRK